MQVMAKKQFRGYLAKSAQQIVQNQTQMVSERVKIVKKLALGRYWGVLGNFLGPKMIKRGPMSFLCPFWASVWTPNGTPKFQKIVS